MSDVNFDKYNVWPMHPDIKGLSDIAISLGREGAADYVSLAEWAAVRALTAFEHGDTESFENARQVFEQARKTAEVLSEAPFSELLAERIFREDNYTEGSYRKFGKTAIRDVA